MLQVYESTPEEFLEIAGSGEKIILLTCPYLMLFMYSSFPCSQRRRHRCQCLCGADARTALQSQGGGYCEHSSVSNAWNWAVS